MTENPMHMIYWRIASAATHMALAMDPELTSDEVNPCDADPMVDSLVADIAETIQRREALR